MTRVPKDTPSRADWVLVRTHTGLSEGQQEGGVCEPRGEASEDTSPPRAPTLDVQLQGRERLLSVSHLVCGICESSRAE